MYAVEVIGLHNAQALLHRETRRGLAHVTERTGLEFTGSRLLGSGVRGGGPQVSPPHELCHLIHPLQLERKLVAGSATLDAIEAEVACKEAVGTLVESSLSRPTYGIL